MEIRRDTLKFSDKNRPYLWHLEEMKKLWIFPFVLLICNCLQTDPQKTENPQTQTVSQTTEAKIAKLIKTKEAIAPFFKLMGKPQKNDWLEAFPEPGETFEEYLKNKPTLPTAARKTIYIQPIGNFSALQRRVLLLTAGYMRAYYNLPVQLKSEKKLGNVPKEMTRKNSYTGQTQIKTNYFLRDLLPKMLPGDAAALICFTNSDLFPEENWSFVFGQANLQSRVGVWSLYRFGNPAKSDADYKLFLARTLKIAMHETGHMFSMRHCTKYECLMSGTNHLGETDRRPLDVCPECMTKIAWAMNYEPAERYAKLAKFWNEQNWMEEVKSFTKKAEVANNVH